MSHQLTADILNDGLLTERIGRQITVLPDIDSTNSYALDHLATQHGPSSDGHVVFAEHQSAGRGRLGRNWLAPRGAGLTLTALLWEQPGALPTARLIMAAAIAVARAVECATDIVPAIHWPNDVYVRNKKLAGILVEARACANQPMPIAVGIGLNCLQHRNHFPPELRDTATSLEIESRQPIDRATVARALLTELDRCFSKLHPLTDEAIADEWRQQSSDIGARVTLTSDGQTFTGLIIDINPHAGLLLQLDNGTRREFDLATITRA
ncbi:MAG: biotin--[acetyl-CoA-carboxylase] ligase [Planctomycetota bacterium]